MNRKGVIYTYISLARERDKEGEEFYGGQDSLLPGYEYWSEVDLMKDLRDRNLCQYNPHTEVVSLNPLG